MNYNKFIKVFKEQYGEIKTNEIIEAGFSFADITKLVNAKILRKSVRGIYILDYKNDVNDYLKMAKKSENAENLTTALYYYNMAEWLNDDERMTFIYYRKLWLLISMDNYSEALSTIEKLINMKNSEKYYGVINITLKLLSEFHEIDPKLITKTEGFKITIKSNKISKESEEYLQRVIYNIKKGCYFHAEYLIDKAMEISCNQPFYVFKLFKLLLRNVCTYQKESEDSFTEEGKQVYNNKINEL